MGIIIILQNDVWKRNWHWEFQFVEYAWTKVLGHILETALYEWIYPHSPANKIQNLKSVN